METKIAEKRIFIGHGGNPIWREFKDFIQDNLKLTPDEFNCEAVAGLTNKERLQQMLNNACFAFLIMTAENEYADKTKHARENVIHEIGLFQGCLSFEKAIVLLEEGCKEFSNLIGIQQIRFPKGEIRATFEQVRGVLKREGILKTLQSGKNRTVDSLRHSALSRRPMGHSLRPRPR